MTFKQHQASVSLFVVIISTLLISVITVSFVRLMIIGQQQASEDDLSQSAYDSALAGVEDSKRAILKYYSICDNSSDEDCQNALTELISSDCNNAVETLIDVDQGDDEISVSDTMNQAYTCTKVSLQTADYLGMLERDGVDVVPLIGVSEFDQVKLEWFSSNDLSDFDGVIEVPEFSLGTPLLSQSDWDVIQPPILRAQLIYFGETGFRISDFDNNSNGVKNSSLFLYPTDISTNSTSFASDVRLDSKDIKQIHCDEDLLTNNYACYVTINLTVSVTQDSQAFLVIKSIYNNTNYRVSLINSSNSSIVNFDGVQPEVDSTGRADDLFRRVKARVSFADSSLYPVGSVLLEGNLCKNFLVTDSVLDYVNNCTP